MSDRRRGFTLLEVLVALALTLAVALAAGDLYRSVLRVATASSGLDVRWARENFARTQLATAERQRTEATALFVGEAERLVFITARSARHGFDGPPALVTYRFDPGARRVRYAEFALPPWWDRDEDALRRELSDRRAAGSAGYRATLVDDVDGWRFSYWDEGDERWKAQWRAAAMPAAIRATWRRRGQAREWLLPVGALYWSTSSG